MRLIQGDTIGRRKVERFIKDDNPGTSGDMNKRLAHKLIIRDKVSILA